MIMKGAIVASKLIAIYTIRENMSCFSTGPRFDLRYRAKIGACLSSTSSSVSAHAHLPLLPHFDTMRDHRNSGP